MTCIVGLERNGKVYIGGDSAGVAGLSITVRADEKVFKNGPMIFGFTSSFRMGQILRFQLSIPAQEADKSDYEYMCTNFIDAVMICMESHGFLKNDKGEKSGGTFLVGYKGRLYSVHSDFQVGRSIERYDSVGCGSDLALGAVHALIEKRGLKPEFIVEQGLLAAEKFSGGVARPFIIDSI